MVHWRCHRARGHGDRGLGVWQAVLAAGVTFADETDHGWDRTPELDRLADGTAGLIFLAITVVALVLAARPVQRTGLLGWLRAALTVTGVLLLRAAGGVFEARRRTTCSAWPTSVCCGLSVICWPVAGVTDGAGWR
ncbi:hypothetical protein FNH13_15200 [Ornithinimicrobium ciconiae]|uniref:Uncharacterized protein n=1 Tax=Ornithinimicrobium ciconiae TaxID=2594265 RepID=A0A516GDB1_9MICO|nr:hypothetical protein [Ornithinimicrobium ciconiae]QDO89513.1 hypothetical protein FNH13_15200 [Ornithinimicrobium ciconiae]